MLEALYLILIAPIEIGMQFVFERASNLSGSYGLAIIILSFVVTLVVSPLYHVAETWQNAERLTTQKFAAKANEIKAVFKGQERFMMMRTLYRQNHYHPIMAVRSIFGFLIQIPFFFAAYQFLGNYTVLEGQEFLIFGNLAKPDALISIADYSINVMPFAMTLMNFASAFIYGNNLSRKDKIQLYIVSLIFLVLLYTSPVALVFYWTVNNFFALIKNILYKKFNLLGNTNSNVDMSIKAPLTTIPQHTTVGTARVKEYITKFLVSLGNFIGSYSPPNWGLFLIGAFVVYNISVYSILKVSFLSDQTNLLNEKLTYFSIKASLVLTLYLVVVLGGKFFQTFSFTKLNLTKLAVLCIPAFGLLHSAYSYKYIVVSADKKLLAMESMLFYIFLVLLSVFIFLSIGRIKKLIENNFELDLIRSLPHRIYFAASLLLAALIFIHTPLALLITDLSVLKTLTLTEFLIDISTYFIVFSAIFGFIYLGFPKKYRGLLTLISICLALSAILYTYVFTGHFGAIDSFKLQHEKGLYNAFNPVYDVIIFISILAGLNFLFKLGKIKKLFQFFILLHVSFLAMSIVSLLGVENISENRTDDVEHSNLLPDYNRDLLSYTKKGNNVVILMLDMFSGDNIQLMLDAYPEFYDLLDGFIWYPNTLTAGSATFQGEPGIHGGHYYTPKQINERKVDSLENEIARGYEIFSSSFGKQGYDVVVAGLSRQTTSCNKVKDHLTTPVKLCVNSTALNHDYLNYWLDRNNDRMLEWYKYEKISNVSLGLSVLSFFKAAPYTARPYIYDSRSWMGTYDYHVADIKEAITRFSFIDSLSIASNTESEKSTFKYIQSKSTHFPYALSANCQINNRESVKTTSKKESGEKNIKHRKHTTCIMRSLVTWLDWLKVNGIYDNTKIIMVSDHGFGRMQGSGIYRGHALMLVKDFNSSGSLAIKNNFLSNADTPSIACSAIGGCESIIPDPTKYPIANRSLFHTNGPWNKSANNIDSYVIYDQYEVRDDIFDVSNWKKIK